MFRSALRWCRLVVILGVVVSACGAPSDLADEESEAPVSDADSSGDVACSSAGGTTFSSSFLNGPELSRDEFADTSVGAVLEAFFVDGPGAPEGGQYERADGFSIVSDSLVLGYNGELPNSFFAIEDGDITGWGSCSPNLVSEDLVAARWEPDGPINIRGQTVAINVDGGACVTDDGQDVLTELVDVDVEESESQVTITAWTRDKPFDGLCAGVGITLDAEVELASPLSERTLLDGGPIPARVVDFEASDEPPPPTTIPDVGKSSLDRLDCSPGIVVEKRVPDSGQDPLDIARDAEPDVIEVEEGRPLWWWGLNQDGTVIVGLALGDMDGADYQVWTCDGQ